MQIEWDLAGRADVDRKLARVAEEQLTPVVCSGTTGVTTEDDLMSDDLLEQGIRLIRQAFAAEGKRAVDEFVANFNPLLAGQRQT